MKTAEKKTSQISAPKNPQAGSSRSGTARTTSRTPSPDTSHRSEATRNGRTRDSVNLTGERDAGAGNPRNGVSGLLSGLSDWAGSGTQSADMTSAPPAAEGSTPVNQGGEAAAGESPNPTRESQFQALELNEGEFLARGRESNPERVTQLQEILRGGGASLEVDGKFGPQTAAAVREFQRENNLSVDGIVGPETLSALNRAGESAEPRPDLAGQTNGETNPAGETNGTADPNPTVPGQPGQVNFADPNLSPAEQYEHYQRLIEANGGQINPEGATVLGLRGLGVDGQRHEGNSNVGGYDDSFVVLNRGENGEPSVQIFQGATHANQTSSSASHGPDQNGNTVRGVAMLRPGNYDVDFAGGNYQGRWGAAYHVRTQDGNGLVPAYRDTNADGQISSQERAAAEQHGYQASAILFHSGKYDRPSSIGCQTLLPSQHEAFSQAVGRSGFNFTLLDANNSVLPQ